MRHIGIDPGLSGAVAIINGEGSKGLGIADTVYDTPTGQIGNKNSYLPAEMAKQLILVGPCQALIEKQQAMPKQGVTSTFSIGYGMGLWIGILAALSIPYEVVTPQAWKGAMMAGMGRDKDASRLRAQQLWPQLTEQLNRKKDHGRAEALLIAEYGRRQISKGSLR